MVAEHEKDISHIYDALSHPFRKRIITIIGEKKRAGFTDLKTELNVSVGTLYYHIDVLGDLLTQDEKRKYVLTEKGELAFRLLTSSEERFEALKTHKPPTESKFFYHLKSFFLPKGLFSYISSKPIIGILTAFGIIAYGSWISAKAGLEPILFFFNSQTKSAPLMIMAEFWVVWITLYALCEGFSFLLYRRKEEHLTLLSSTAFSLIPLIIFSSVWFICRQLNPSLLLGQTAWWTNLLLFVLQIWSISLLSVGVSVSKALRIDKAAVLSFIIIYLNIAYIFIFVTKFTI